MPRYTVLIPAYRRTYVSTRTDTLPRLIYKPKDKDSYEADKKSYTFTYKRRCCVVRQGTLVATVREVKPTAFLGVPSVWETMKERITSTMRAQSLCRRLLIQCARAVGLRGNLALMNRYLQTSLYITRGMVSVRSSVTLGVASSVANDVIMKMTS